MRRSWNGRGWPNKERIASAVNPFSGNPFFFSPSEHLALTKRNIAPKVVALVVIAAMLVVAGFAPVAAVGLLIVGLFIFIAVRRAAKRETDLIFAFYVAADEVLRDDDGRRYHFEVAEVINAGERVVGSMPDPPPLTSFALGALYSLTGNHDAVVQHLGLAAEEELLKESPRVAPSRRLRRYVKRLRQIERAPNRWPRISSAIQNLEQMHEQKAARLLAKSQQHLKRLVETYHGEIAEKESRTHVARLSDQPTDSVKPQPSISEVLTDVYREESETT